MNTTTVASSETTVTWTDLLKPSEIAIDSALTETRIVNTLVPTNIADTVFSELSLRF